MLELERWRELVQRLGSKSDMDELFLRLCEAYSEPHRAYHTSDHIEHSLCELDRAADLAERLGEVEVAIWFHDAIYTLGATDNEEQSARWAAAALAAAGILAPVVMRVADLILATRHDTVPLHSDARLMVDIDLSTLGCPPKEFAKYERQIRQEHQSVPEPTYRKKRVELLQSFLSRESIYLTEFFHNLYEMQARENLSRSIAALRGA
jgi:predicted metal-dependent HD superfamily phosphohydrolase